MKYPFTVAIIGSGYMGKRHMSVFCEKVERLILCSNDEEGGKALAAQYGCAFYGDYKEMLKKEKREAELLIPYAEAGLLNLLRGECAILEEPRYLDDGILVKCLLDNKNYGRFSRFILGQKENE